MLLMMRDSRVVRRVHPYPHCNVCPHCMHTCAYTHTFVHTRVYVFIAQCIGHSVQSHQIVASILLLHYAGDVHVWHFDRTPIATCHLCSVTDDHRRSSSALLTLQNVVLINVHKHCVHMSANSPGRHRNRQDKKARERRAC